MTQVSVRDCRGGDRGWIQGVYREYLIDLAPTATGLFPMLAETGQREPEQWARFFAGQHAHVLTICYGEQPVGFAKIATQPLRGAANSAAAPTPAGAKAAVPSAGATPAAASGKAARVAVAVGARANPVEFSMAEFFIARPWRRRGIGAQAARLILDRFEGRWLITEYLRNDAAVRFWRHVVLTYTGGQYQESIVSGEVQQRFESGRRRSAR